MRRNTSLKSLSPAIGKTAASHTPGKYWPYVKWGLIGLALLAFLYFCALPVRSRLSHQYLETGDKLLLERHYVAAQLAYEKALYLSAKNTAASDRIKLLADGSRDITKLENYYHDRQANDLLDLYKEATVVPKSETEAAKLARQFIESGEYQFAVIPAQTAIEMDKNYRDAWLYLGIAYLKSGQYLELPPETRDYYFTKSREALDRAKELDPNYQPTLDFLAQAKDQKPTS